MRNEMFGNDSINQDSFSDRFRRLRKQKNYSQAELGEIVGIHYTHIGRYERGLSKPTASTAKLLADALGTTVDYLMHGEMDDIAKSKLEDRELLNLFKEIEGFPEQDRVVIKRLINAFVAMKLIEERIAVSKG
jgi:transcriptional regulator with XRE-family HTH domain